MAPDVQRAQTVTHRLNRALMVAPIACSILALAIVLGNVAAGVERQADEGGWAHLFQLLIAGQLPLVLLFLATADWSRTGRLLLTLLLQGLAGLCALGALAWSGY